MNDAVLKEGLNGGKSGGASCEMMRKETSVRTVCFKKMKKVWCETWGKWHFEPRPCLAHFGNHDNRQQIACRRGYLGILKKGGRKLDDRKIQNYLLRN